MASILVFGMFLKEEFMRHSFSSAQDVIITWSLDSEGICISSYGWVMVIKFGEQIQFLEKSLPSTPL